MLTGEYFVLDGALALALPTQQGQSLQIKKGNKDLQWSSYDENGLLWFQATFSLPSCTCQTSSDASIGQRLESILKAIEIQRPGFWAQQEPVNIETQLDFPRKWGLGTSSTLIVNMAQWAEINAYQLLGDTFGGSGYDIACAQASGPISYQLVDDTPRVRSARFSPSFKKCLYFVYLEQKQNSREGIERYRKRKIWPETITQISEISRKFEQADSLEAFEKLMQIHEEIVAGSIGLERAQQRYFSDFWGQVKSLGAWGGDFVLATSLNSEQETKKYFNEKGFETVLKYEDLIK